MHEETKKWLNEIIQSNRLAIKNPGAKRFMKINPDYIADLTNENQENIDIAIIELREQINQLKPFILRIKGNVIDITEETPTCASYLLLCSILNEWESLLLLAQQWKYSSVSTILRKINEAIDICDLFAFDTKNWIVKNIQSWFSWGTIQNQLTREAHDKATPIEAWIDVATLCSHIYQMESHWAHNGYASILENISPFAEDFDFNWPTGLHRTVSALKSAKYCMTNLIQCLRFVYLIILRDFVWELELEKILKIYNPSIWKNEIPKELRDTFGRKEK